MDSSGIRDGWMTDRRQREESGIRKEELGNGRMEIGIRKEETAKWKQDRENRNEELGIRKKTMNEKLGLRFRYTWDIIEVADKGLLPDKVMINIHPQRWNDKPWPWVKEFVGQNVKNIIKRYIIYMGDVHKLINNST